MTEITPEYLASQGLSDDFPSRFFSKVQITPSCWFWTGFRRKTGQPYGEIYRGQLVRGSYCILAHRASWILHFGPIPEGLGVLHDCPDGDCPYCINPAHLWLGTDSDNFKDMWTKGRANIVTANLGGERNHLAKLTDEQANDIRKTYKPWVVSAPTLAVKFGVPLSVIKRVLQGKTYRNIVR